MAVYEELMLAEGDRVSATGRVVAHDGMTWFEPPLPVHAIYYSDGGPVHRATHLAVPLIGVDLAALPERRQRDGVVEGRARVVGVWRKDALISETLLPSPPAQSAAGHRWRVPPCPE